MCEQADERLKNSAVATAAGQTGMFILRLHLSDCLDFNITKCF